MKKLLLILLCFPIIGFGQDYFYPPKEINLDLEDRFGSVYNLPEFYPIGWSKDGMFSYKIIYCSGGCGCCNNSICI